MIVRAVGGAEAGQPICKFSQSLIMPYSENSAHFERKFDIDRIVQF